MIDHEKAEQILYALMRICPSRNVVLLQSDDILRYIIRNNYSNEYAYTAMFRKRIRKG